MQAAVLAACGFMVIGGFMSLPLVTVGNPKKKKGRSHRKSGGKRRSNPKLGQKAKAAARKVGGYVKRGAGAYVSRAKSNLLPALKSTALVAGAAGLASVAGAMIVSKVSLENRNKASWGVTFGCLLGGLLLTPINPMLGIGVMTAGAFSVGRRALGQFDKNGTITAPLSEARALEMRGFDGAAGLGAIEDQFRGKAPGAYSDQLGRKYWWDGARVLVDRNSLAGTDGVGAADVTFDEMAGVDGLGAAETFDQVGEIGAVPATGAPTITNPYARANRLKFAHVSI
jgi:hypothetical protein